MKKFLIKHRLRIAGKLESYFMITIGTIIMSAGAYYFLIEEGLITGGVTGVSIIINHYFPTVSISLITLILNVFFLLLGLIVIGKKLFIRSCFGSLLIPISFYVFEILDFSFGVEDSLLVVVYGGGLVGFGFGLVMRYGGTTGGMDIPIKIVNRLFKVPLSKSVYIFDGTVVALGIVLLINDLGDQAFINGLYAILVMYVTGVVADFVVMGGTSKKACNIITTKPDEIKELIFMRMNRGLTEIRVSGGYTNDDKKMLVVVITKNQYHIIRNVIAEVDENAFVYVTPASEIHGEFYVEGDEE